MLKLGFYSILRRNLLVLFLLIITFSGHTQKKPNDSELSSVYLDALRKAYKEADLDTIKGVLRKSEDFFKLSSDYSFFKGYVAQNDLDYENAITMYRQALTRFTNTQSIVKVVSPNIIINEVIPIYYRLQRYNEIIYLYNSYPLLFNESTAYFYLLALKNTANTNLLLSEGERLALVYPSDAKIFCALFDETDFRTNFLPILRNISQNYTYNIANLQDRSIILARINAMKNKNLQAEVLTLYANFLKLDANYQYFINLYKIALPPSPTPTIVLTSFFNIFDRNMQRDYADSAKKETLNFGDDINFDGIPDRYITMNRNRLAVSFDKNQDKKIEYSVIYLDNKINYIEDFGDDKIQYYFFKQFPYLSSVAVTPLNNPLPSKSSDATIYSIEDTSYDFRQFFDKSFELFTKYDKVPVWDNSLNLENDLLKKNSFLIDEYVQGIHIRKVHLRKGKITSVVNNPDEVESTNLNDSIARDLKVNPSELK